MIGKDHLQRTRNLKANRDESPAKSRCPQHGEFPLRIHGTGIFTHIWVVFVVNVGKYTIHGSYGIFHPCYKQTPDIFQSFSPCETASSAKTTVGKGWTKKAIVSLHIEKVQRNTRYHCVHETPQTFGQHQTITNNYKSHWTLPQKGCHNQNQKAQLHNRSPSLLIGYQYLSHGCSTYPLLTVGFP